MKSLSLPMLYLFDSYPREKSSPYRLGIVKDRGEAIQFVNAHNGRTNVYQGIDEPGNIAARAVRQIIDRFCGGSVEQLLVGMVANDGVTSTVQVITRA